MAGRNDEAGQSPAVGAALVSAVGLGIRVVRVVRLVAPLLDTLNAELCPAIKIFYGVRTSRQNAWVQWPWKDEISTQSRAQITLAY